MGHKPFDDILLKVRRGTWRTTICRLIGAEREMERLQKFVLADSERIGILENEKQELATKILRQARAQQAMFDAARQTGQNDVLNLIARWGVCRPLEGYNGKQMAEALRKVITPTIAPYTDYKGIGQLASEGALDGWVSYPETHTTEPRRRCATGTHHPYDPAHNPIGRPGCPCCDPK